MAVDTALLTLDPSDPELLVLEVRRTDTPGWALPGTFLHTGERLADAVERSLQAKADVRGLRPRQLHVYDDPARDSRGWVLSVAHVEVVPIRRLDSRRPGDTRLVSVARPGRLGYGHAEIIARAVREVRDRYAEQPDPDHLLGRQFTLGDLHRVHQAVAGLPLQRDGFRRLMKPMLRPTGHLLTRTGGRPAELFLRASNR
ncbi:NUDIX domain-containing protein [Mycolicibacterium sp. P1-5]|uniref:NUDIX hydrolase n=1 Tax=Mycolicibacterium sp. P1-5 TaxID=2024617 RepID=UPI0011EF267D|nr:NUDIX domain-containing protein [Mycolicibacterium sp. P1-5]KAA0107909.1 NUDIX domain-containing protein [Mycolicibacterium sp. P1-5]